MCWNQEVSLNTFLFSSFVLGLVVYNNAYTQYKIKEFNNVWMYAVYFIFISMQLAETLIWRNINNPFYNNLFTLSALLILYLQPIASLMLLTNLKIRNILLPAYAIFGALYNIYVIKTGKILSSVSPKGHLIWNLKGNDSLSHFAFLVWTFCLFFSAFYEGKWIYILFGIPLLLLTFYNYASDNSAGSLWCWSVNAISVFLAAHLLFYLPFCVNKSIC
jgi:hypothetical protein